MTINPLGQGVSRYTDGRDKQFGGVVFQANKPPLDSELNLISLVELEARAETVRAQMASGWLMNESNPRADFHTSPNYSNQFYFGRQTSGEVRNVLWAAVNGWMVPVTGTKTGAPPLAANDSDTWNRILLNPPSTSTGGNRAEFAFLEVWLTRIDVDPASPGIANGKPQRGSIYRFGNVESGFSYLADDLVDPDVNYETTSRIQVQYRLRVVADVNLAQYPEGFDSTLVFAQGSLSTPSVVPFTNMRQELGDPGLWRAGTGDPSTFGTVDGYVYAIPLCAVFRRNAASFSDVGNLAGSFNRNSVALNRNGATTFTNSITLPADLSEVDSSITLTSISGTVLATINAFGEAYFKIDDEIVRVTNVIANSPTDFTVNIDRGQLQTIVRAHVSGKQLVPYTVRPDGLFADQVASSDILDLRHSVAQKFDHDSILKTGLTELMKGNLRTAWKRYGSTNSAGAMVLYGDRITDSSVFVGGLTRLDGPDGNRRVYSDAVTVQRFNVPVSVPTNSTSLNAARQVTVAPYNITVNWTGHPSSHGPSSRLYTSTSPAGSYPAWWNGDQLTIKIDNFRTGLPVGDEGQVRFATTDDDPDAVIIRFEGMTTDPNGAVISETTSGTVTTPNLDVAPPTGTKAILKPGAGISVAIDNFDNMVITLQSGTVNTVLNEFVYAMQNNANSTYAGKLVMHIEFAVIYGAGRGLSHKPDVIHTVQFRGSPTNSSKIMLRGGLTDKDRMIPTYLCDSPYVQTGNNRSLARTSEVMIDPGSKTVYVAPYRSVLVPSLLSRNGDQLNWYFESEELQYQGMMPTLGEGGVGTAHTTVDPLDLFLNGSESRYVEVPMEYLPRPGLHHIPIQPITTTVFPSGLNFLLMSKEGPNSTTSGYNQDLVQYPSGAPGYYIATPIVGETYGTSSGSYTMFGQKYSNSSIRSAAGGPFRGIKFPPFIAPARITGVYERAASAGPGFLTPSSTPFDNNRVYVGGPGTDVNLLRDSYDGPTVLLDVDSNGDLYFVLNADALDLTNASSTDFDDIEFLVECTVFGFDRGFLQTNGRLCIAKLGAGGTSSLAQDTFTSNSDNVVGIITPAPLATDASNNEITVYYTREPYQGDVFGTQGSYSDDAYRLGPLTVSEASGIHDNPLGSIPTLSLPNKAGFEILSATSFVTSLGTGRMSGPVPLPLLNKEEAPNNPTDYSGTWVDLDRKFSYNRVGYEDWATPKFPVATASFADRPEVLLGGMSEIYDHDVHPEFAGCVARLPLGSYFRDKDFLGKTLWQSRSTSGVGSIALGSMAFVDYKASMTHGVAGNSTWEGTEFVCGNSSGTAGVGSESIIKVDGTSSPTSTTVFKTTRGGAAYSATGPWPGGVLATRFPKARPNIEAGAVLMGTAYLVRSQPESVGMAEVHMGSELQLVVVTHAVPAYFRDTDSVHSASGTNEGYTAVDRFRLPGRPLEKRRGEVDTTITPTLPPIFVNKIYDNPLFFGSSDVPLTSQKQESFTVTDDATSFSLSQRPLDPGGVQLFLNGVKLQYGVNYTVGGTTNQTVTYIPSESTPALVEDDKLEAWYLLF